MCVCVCMHVCTILCVCVREGVLKIGLGLTIIYGACVCMHNIVRVVRERGSVSWCTIKSK